MRKSQDEISREDLLAAAGEAGESITRHQLVRWHKEGLIARPRVVHHGKGKGTTSMYPAAMLRQVVYLSPFMQSGGTFDRAAWHLWSAGFPVTPRYRAALLRALDRRIEAGRAAIDGFEAGTPGNAIDNAAAARATGSLAAVRSDDRPLLVRALAALQLGTFSFDEYGAEDLISLMTQLRQQGSATWLRALFVDQTDRRAPRAAREAAQQERALIEREVRDLSVVHLRETVARLSDAQLERDRARAREFWDALNESTEFRLPLSQPIFLAVVVARRASRLLRHLLIEGGAFMRARGFASFREVVNAQRSGTLSR